MTTLPDFTVDEFLDWARTKPIDESYDYINNYICPIAQFLNETGRAKAAFVLPEIFGDPGTWYDDGIPLKRGKKPLQHHYVKGISESARALNKLATFGQMVERLEAVLAEKAAKKKKK